MSDFIFSLNATIPVFLLMLSGWLLGRHGMFTEEFCKVSNKFVFHIALPILLFRDIASTDIHQVFNIRFLLFCMIVTTICFFTIWGLAKVFIKDKSITGAFVQASFRGSAAILGIAFIQNIYGNSGMAPLMIIGAVPLFNIYSVIVLTFEGESEDKNGIQKAVVNIVKNPIILGIFIGLVFSLFHWYEKLPMILTKTVGNVAGMASPLALLVTGAGFEGRKALTKIKPTMVATLIKLVVMPAFFLPIAAWMGFRGQDMVALLIMLGAPTTVTCYIMAVNMKNDGILSSSIIVSATLLSSITLTGWIYFLRVMNMI